MEAAWEIYLVFRRVDHRVHELMDMRRRMVLEVLSVDFHSI